MCRRIWACKPRTKIETPRRAAPPFRLEACFAVGVEASDRAALGTLALTYNRAERAAIARAFVTPEDLRAWPQFDAVICMSVAHHIFRAHGLEAAQDFIAACASSAARVLIFEMGTGEEKAFEAALPSEARDQERFVRALLERAGLKTVRIIAETGAYHQGATHLLFAAEPAAKRTAPGGDAAPRAARRTAQASCCRLSCCQNPQRVT